MGFQDRGKKKGSSGGGFQSLGLSDEVYRGIVKMGYRMPTPVQRKTLPVVLSGIDTVAMARTGSGKTAAFIIPMLERLLSSRGVGAAETIHADRGRSAGGVILSPTRELSLQTLRVCQTLSTFTGLTSIGINGGESMEKQFTLLASRPDIIVATPGRLAHHLTEIPDFHLKNCEIVVFDEADRLFEMGFAMQIRQIVGKMPGHENGRQTLMFSATMPKVLIEFTKSGIMGEPEVVRLDSEVSVSAELRCGFVTVRSGEKDPALLHLLRDVLPTSMVNKTDDEEKVQKRHRGGIGAVAGQLGLTLIFVATRHHVDYLTTLLNAANLGITATGIYGTMDLSARKENLAKFRSGEFSILVVTDVAARGIDIPLIDHVIHYAFPPSAKLFVHRSGRAARAGRIGYCWGIVDSEELPYMVDLHLFLGRRLCNGKAGEAEAGHLEGEDHNEDDSRTNEEDESYSLLDMTPDMVHYGCVPEMTLVEEVENVRRITNSELTGSHDAEALRALTRVCYNAMKQYRRSRPEASKAGVRRARAILEGAKDNKGHRSGGCIMPHPVLRFTETEKLLRGVSEGSKGKEKEKQVRAKMEDMKKRDEMLRAMSSFRPKETIFEAFATGKAKDGGVVGQVDRGRTTQGATKKNRSEAALGAMKSMRRQMKLARNKGSTLIVAGSHNAAVINGDETEEGEEGDASNTEILVSETSVRQAPRVLSTPANPPPESKRRMSKAERKRLKKNPYAASVDPTTESGKKTKEKRGSDFRDKDFYMANDVAAPTEASERTRQMEAAMQPSASSGKGLAVSALKLEESMLDIVGDENEDMVKRQRMMRWDKSKRKYVQTTIGSELSGDSKSKKIRLESGQLVNSGKMKLGELYEKWQKKSNKSIGRYGVFDEGDDEDGDRGVSMIKRRTEGAGGKYDDGAKTKKTADQIRKERDQKQNMKIKNMKKDDRRRLERQGRADKKTSKEEVMSKAALKASRRGRKGANGRWAGNKRK